jgi:hypothetical protein
MSRTGKVRLFFGDGEHDFRIGVGEAEELDERFSVGLVTVQERVMLVHVATIREVLRIGLTGGGMKPAAAVALVARHVRDGYFLDAAATAAKVIEAAVKGVPEDMPGEPDGEGAATPSPTPG